MRAPLFSMIFIIVWLGALGAGMIVSIFHSMNNLSNAFSSDLVGFLTMILFGFLLLFISLNVQANDSKEFLESILEGQIIV